LSNRIEVDGAKGLARTCFPLGRAQRAEDIVRLKSLDVIRHRSELGESMGQLWIGNWRRSSSERGDAIVSVRSEQLIEARPTDQTGAADQQG
jgi:hypothetical protein